MILKRLKNLWALSAYRVDEKVMLKKDVQPKARPATIITPNPLTDVQTITHTR